MKGFASISLFVIVALIAACAPAQPVAVAPTEISAAPAATTAPSAGTVLTVGMVTSGSLGDNGIFDLSLAGLERAKKELGVDFKVLEGKEDPSLYYNLLETAAQNYKLVIVNPGYQFSEALKEIAPKYPGTTFIYMDGASDVQGANISSMSTSDHEGSYLAGILAAGMTTLDKEGLNPDKQVGLVGAIDAPVINNFIAGFKNGVVSVDPAMEVKVLYAGAFDNPAKGKELATSLYDQKVDIVYNVAAQTGQGVLLAAKETGHYAIGVDTDQCPVQAGSVLASMLKRFDITTFLMVEAMAKGELKGGQVYSYGLKEGGVELRMCPETADVVPQDLVKKIDDAKAKIVSGEIEVDSVK